MRNWKSWLGAAAAFVLLDSPAELQSKVIHVRPGAAGDGSGSSWPNAVSSLAGALPLASAGDEVWVTAGIHQAPAPTAVNPETPPFPGGPVGPLANTTAAFVFGPGVRLLGGFAGTETAAAQRDIPAHPTVLVAACLNGSRAAFVYKSEAELLDGFVIDGQLQSAGGMFGGLTRNCIFQYCRATPGIIFGRLHDQPGAALTTTGRVERCSFTGNVSTTSAAVWASNAVLIHCTIVGNRNLGDTLQGVRGGGLVVTNSRMENCLVAGNRIEMTRVTASSRGGGIAGSCELVNCTVVNNLVLHPVVEAAIGGGAHLDGGSIQNSIFWGNNSNDGRQLVVAPATSVSYSLVPGGFPGTGNLALDPLFANAAAGNFRLTGSSPAVDAGLATGGVALADRDLDDKPRIIDGNTDGLAAPDLGAYEFGDYAEFLGIVIGPSRKARLDLGASVATGWRLEASTNLVEWNDLGAPSPNGSQFIYRDESAPGIQRRFYRIVAP